jgi:hypothetical protein
MEKLVNCAFNMDTACVELHFTEGSIYSINCTAVENEAADNGACCLTVSQAMIKRNCPKCRIIMKARAVRFKRLMKPCSFDF